ncbi:MAG: cobyric acid synthase [Euryarchaeota archaeon]|nr:cobyric acid synthase [Euryarchaeota archaeon]
MMVDSEGEKEDYWDKVVESLSRPNGTNVDCEYYPCHHQGQDCTLCFCPFYPCLDDRLGKYVKSRRGGQVWSCEDCLWIHRPDVGRDVKMRLHGSDRPTHNELLLIKKDIERLYRIRAKSIMIMGATSGAGKTLLVAALCRIFADKGMRVAPFKSQNMSTSSAIATEGGEISQAQAIQAFACRLEPESRMNPILLKPEGDNISQVIVLGQPYQKMDARTYYDDFVTNEGYGIVKNSFDHLARRFDLVVIEGAGSPAEINLSDVDLANMKTAEITNAPCILIVNIEWGGAFAYAYGTLMLLSPEQRSRFKGIVINNMHGSATDLQKGIDKLERLLGIPVLGVVPHIDHSLPEEDSQGAHDRSNSRGPVNKEIDVNIARIASTVAEHVDIESILKIMEDGV